VTKVEIKTVSAAKMLSYLKCPRQFYYAYGEGIFPEETKYTRFGSFIHAVLENYLKHLISTDRKKDLETLYSIVSAKKKEYAQIPETGEVSFFEADVFLNRFASALINTRRVYAVEKIFDIPWISGGEEIRINGRIDRIDIETGQNKETILHIIDYKTGKNKLTEEDLKNDIQMKFYVTAAYLMYRKIHRLFRISHYYIRDNSLVSFETVYKDSYAEELLKCIQKMKNDSEYPKNIAAHCFRCPSFKICKPDVLVKSEKKIPS